MTCPPTTERTTTVTGRHDVELLWFADRPDHVAARELLREVVAELAGFSDVRRARTARRR